MRTIATAILLLAVVSAVPATAEPPPQAAVQSAPTQTVSDASSSYVDTIRQAPATVAPADSTLVSAPRHGHGWVFWTVLIVALAGIGVLAYKFIKREPASIEASPRASGGYEPPDPGSRRPPRKNQNDD